MKVKIVRNNIIPLKGFCAMTMFPFIFTRRNLREKEMYHELIHCRQQVEMLILPFFIWYVLEWLIRIIIYFDTKKAYKNISFEKEAYSNQEDKDYLKERNFYSWIKYI